LIGRLAVLAFSRKGSGALPAGRLVDLRSFTIRKAKGKINNKKQPKGCFPFVFNAFGFERFSARLVRRLAANGTGTYGM
jgi:hypothetical protein